MARAACHLVSSLTRAGQPRVNHRKLGLLSTQQGNLSWPAWFEIAEGKDGTLSTSLFEKAEATH